MAGEIKGQPTLRERIKAASDPSSGADNPPTAPKPKRSLDLQAFADAEVSFKADGEMRTIPVSEMVTMAQKGWKVDELNARWGQEKQELMERAQRGDLYTQLQENFARNPDAVIQALTTQARSAGHEVGSPVGEEGFVDPQMADVQAQLNQLTQAMTSLTQGLTQMQAVQQEYSSMDALGVKYPDVDRNAVLTYAQENHLAADQLEVAYLAIRGQQALQGQQDQQNQANLLNQQKQELPLLPGSPTGTQIPPPAAPPANEPRQRTRYGTSRADVEADFMRAMTDLGIQL